MASAVHTRSYSHLKNNGRRALVLMSAEHYNWIRVTSRRAHRTSTTTTAVESRIKARAGVPAEYRTVRSKPEIALAEIDRVIGRPRGKNTVRRIAGPRAGRIAAMGRQCLRPERRYDVLMDVNPMSGAHDLSPDDWRWF
jgi:hypothetical protein